MSVMTSELAAAVGPEDCSVELSNLRLSATVGHTLCSSLILPAAVGDSSSALFSFPNPLFKIEVEFTSNKINHFKGTVQWLFSTFIILCNFQLY